MLLFVANSMYCRSYSQSRGEDEAGAVAALGGLVKSE
jgi:hypothetical protein